jgi:hypothetical protein
VTDLGWQDFPARPVHELREHPCQRGIVGHTLLSLRVAVLPN